MRSRLVILFLLGAFIHSASASTIENSLEMPLLDNPNGQPYKQPKKTISRNRIASAIVLTTIITALTNYTFPEETIGYFTNQLLAEVIASCVRDTKILKKLGLGLIGAMCGASLDWYYMYPYYKRNLGLGVAGTQTCIMFIRDYLLEDYLGIKLPYPNPQKHRIA